ncbi:MAG: DUF6198 family protein [Clostridia bacterium]
MKKISKMNEIGWILGILLCTLGIALCTKASLGLSMIAAPIYIIHIKLVQFFPWYTQGTSEYIFQIGIIILTVIICRRFRIKYALSFITAILSGFALDFWFFVLGGNGMYDSFFVRVIAFILGECITALSIAFFFRTTMPVQGYELLVSEISDKFKIDVNKVKMVNDIIYLVMSVILALVLNKSLKGVGIGTVIITLVNAPLISLFGKGLDKIFVFDSFFK